LDAEARRGVRWPVDDTIDEKGSSKKILRYDIAEEASYTRRMMDEKHPLVVAANTSQPYCGSRV
jgi:hypothetical protein